MRRILTHPGFINPRQVANHHSDVATQCFRDGLAPLPTACVHQEEVPSASSTRTVARPMPSVDPVMSMTAMVVIPQAGGPARTWVADS